MEAGAMRSVNVGWLLLRLQLALRANPLPVTASLAIAACAIASAWTAHTLTRLEAERDALKAAARSASLPSPVPAVAVAPVVPAAPPPAQSADELDAFYAALGPRRYAEQQVRTLFALAAKNGLSLSQGEYKTGYDRNARVSTYQVNLPVKGSYGAIWQFALGALRAIPFASLDDISFRREAIGDPAVEARLRLTLYLKDVPGGER
jgi:hypothetical protein